MAEVKQKMFCNCGKKKEVFWVEEVEDCVDCTENRVKILEEEFLKTLSPGQLAAHERCEKAKKELVALRILA